MYNCSQCKKEVDQLNFVCDDCMKDHDLQIPLDWQEVAWHLAGVLENMGHGSQAGHFEAAKSWADTIEEDETPPPSNSQILGAIAAGAPIVHCETGEPI